MALELGLMKMKRLGSMGSQMWRWLTTPPQSREPSSHGGSAYAKSRDPSAHGGSAYAKSREPSAHGGSTYARSREPSAHAGGAYKGEKALSEKVEDIWTWATQSPAPSREDSMHGRNFYGMKRNVSLSTQLWNWATGNTHEKGGPDLSTFRSFDAAEDFEPTATTKPPTAANKPTISVEENHVYIC